MARHRDQPDDAGETGQISRPRPYSLADLRARLEQLPESHPSSPKYRGRSGGPADRPGSEASRSGWESPGVADHPGKPSPDAIRLDDDRRRHILDGDPTGGGHRHGAGKPGKTEFPAHWSDHTTFQNILDIARHPDTAEFQKNGRWKVQGRRDNIDLVAVIRPDGYVWTAYPLPGGPGVHENPWSK